MVAWLSGCLWLPVVAWLSVILAPSGTSVFSYEVARRLINVEELEHTLETEEEPYEVACQGRFSSPEFYGPQVAAFERVPRSHRQEGLRLGSLDLRGSS